MTVRRAKNPAGWVTAVVLNPSKPGAVPMAAKKKKKRRSSSGSKRRASSTARKGRSRRRSVRRRKNPSLSGVVLAVAAGIVLGLGYWAVKGAPIPEWAQIGGVVAAGVALGAAATMWEHGAGYGLIGAGVGLGTAAAADRFLVGATPTQTGAIRARLPGGNVAQLNAVRTRIGRQPVQMRGVAASIGL